MEEPPPPVENGISLNKLFILGGRLVNPSKRKHVLKRAESHRCEVNALGIFACKFSMFCKVSASVHSNTLPPHVCGGAP